MVITNTTALCGGYPPTNLQHSAYSLFRLVLEFFQELAEGKVGNLFSPKAFHAREVQVFKEHYSKIGKYVDILGNKTPHLRWRGF